MISSRTIQFLEYFEIISNWSSVVLDNYFYKIFPPFSEFSEIVTGEKTMKVQVAESSNSIAGGQFISSVNKLCLSGEGEQKYVTFDCEGVNLSRLGTVEVVSICFSPTNVFIVDFGGGNPDTDIVGAVKKLFEDTRVIKIIHDARMDCDALFHLHNITLNNVHDTSCFHKEITGQQDKNLNYVLTYNGIEENCVRDSNVYKKNEAYWRTRPFTMEMISWASSDVDKLFEVASKQLKLCSLSQKTCALKNSAKNTVVARDMEVKSGLTVSSPGLFIGRGGSNIRTLQRQTGTLIYGSRGNWFVYYDNKLSLASVEREMRR